MTINRVTFENKGQDFNWWEIDMASGRVVGCGPLAAATWADGHHSVDLATIAVGVRPRLFGRTTGPDGTLLRCAVLAIKPAPLGGGISMPDLTELIALVEAKTAATPFVVRATVAAEGRVQSLDYAERLAAGGRIASELVAEHGARIKTDEPYSMTMGAVRATCTSGHWGLFTNWIIAARRRLAQMEAK